VRTFTFDPEGSVGTAKSSRRPERGVSNLCCLARFRPNGYGHVALKIDSQSLAEQPKAQHQGGRRCRQLSS
jgi:hypothetical protein